VEPGKKDTKGKAPPFMENFIKQYWVPRVESKKQEQLGLAGRSQGHIMKTVPGRKCRKKTKGLSPSQKIVQDRVRSRGTGARTMMDGNKVLG